MDWKQNYKRVIYNEPDFFDFLNESTGNVKGEVTKKQRTEWMKHCGISLPKEYPCFAEFHHHSEEVDDVGMGSRFIIEVDFTYENELKEIIKDAQKLLDQLQLL